MQRGAKQLKDRTDDLKPESSCFECTPCPHLPHTATWVKMSKYQKHIFHDFQYTKSSINSIQDVVPPLLSTTFFKKIQV